MVDEQLNGTATSTGAGATISAASENESEYILAEARLQYRPDSLYELPDYVPASQVRPLRREADPETNFPGALAQPQNTLGLEQQVEVDRQDRIID